MSEKPKPYCCADCGQYAAVDTPCRACGSVRVVLCSVLKDTFGPDWWNECFGPPDGCQEKP